MVVAYRPGSIHFGTTLLARLSYYPFGSALYKRCRWSYYNSNRTIGDSTFCVIANKSLGYVLCYVAKVASLSIEPINSIVIGN
ncbi:hypothetical protein BLOT_000064 [Blomia tropicalis]|nr:hypothetical protein BLOT_000064 [Blomia tropicalis]